MPLDSRFYVNVGPHGTFRPSGDYHTTARDVDRIFEHLATQQIKKLTVHFHGGLIKEKDGAKIAEKMAPLYQAAGSHPVTFVWETGFAETVVRNLNTIHRTQLFKKILAIVLKKALAKLGVDPLGKGPGVELSDAEIKIELETAEPFGALVFQRGAKGGAAQLTEEGIQRLQKEVEAELDEDLDADAEFKALLETEAPTTKLLKSQVLVATLSDKQKGILGVAKAAKALAMVVFRVAKRFVQGRDHDFYPTVVEEICRELYVADLGEWVWGGMKEGAREMWLPNAGLDGDDRHAGRYFLDGLARLQSQTGLMVDLVGHSAGSIAICQMLRTAATMESPLDVRNIFFLAPACRSDLFFEEIVQHPERFARFRSFTMKDAFEKQDRLLGAVYPRSLLYFIAGVLERDVDTPIVGMERYLSGQKPYGDSMLVTLRGFLLTLDGSRLVLSKTDPSAAEGSRSESISHGGFDDDHATRDSLRALIAQ